MFINLHCHTKSVLTGDDKKRDCDTSEIFIKRLKESEINIVAITNHNKFFADQYNDFSKKCIEEKILLLPGIELSVFRKTNNYKKNYFHLIIISDPEKINTFQKIVEDIREKILYPNKNEKTKINEDALKINIDDLLNIICKFDFNPIITVHYGDKTPSIDQESLKYIKKILIKNNKSEWIDTLCCEVSNMKNGSYLDCNEKIILSADNKNWDEGCFKSVEGSLNKCTFISNGCENYKLLKLFIKNSKFGIISTINDELFEIKYSDKNKIKIFQKNLNVIFGERGSGKTYLLNSIYSSIKNNKDNHLKTLFYKTDIKKNESFKKFDDNENDNLKIKETETIDEIKNLNKKNKELKKNIEKNFKEKSFVLTDIIENIHKNKLSNNKFKCFLNSILVNNKNSSNEIIEKINNLNFFDFFDFLKSIISKKKYSSLIKEFKKKLNIKIINELKENIIFSFLNINLDKLKTIINNKNNFFSFKDIFSEYKNKFSKKNQIIINTKNFLKKIKPYSKNTFINFNDWNFCGKISEETYLYFSTFIRPKKGHKLNQWIKSDKFYNKYFWDDFFDLDIDSNNLQTKILYSIKINENFKVFKEVSSGSKIYWELNKIFEDNYDVYIFDEPEKSLDISTVENFIQKNLSNLLKLEKTIILATHSVNLNTVSMPKWIIYTEHNWNDDVYNQFEGTIYSNKLIPINNKKLESKKWSESVLDKLEGGEDNFDLRGFLYGKK